MHISDIILNLLHMVNVKIFVSSLWLFPNNSKMLIAKPLTNLQFKYTKII